MQLRILAIWSLHFWMAPWNTSHVILSVWISGLYSQYWHFCPSLPGQGTPATRSGQNLNGLFCPLPGSGWRVGAPLGNYRYHEVFGMIIIWVLSSLMRYKELNDVLQSRFAWIFYELCIVRKMTVMSPIKMAFYISDVAKPFNFEMA